ncbi:hypothetical protein [Chryseobacterium sp.]|uniref:hypothetical protein n=1 Tax=Chryseobacterium sp. TaxID=1871047 RepID=UPI0011CCDDE3|nr:hypothetical protein [Chryseobacterium sp.]TXF76290.1 hypothetical protein FUA25_10420 [Chryseobacterium sp.]
MKKLIYLASAVVLSFTLSCKKNPVKTEATVSTSAETGKTLRYVGDDGSSALVTFSKTDKGNTISIRSNNKTINLPEKKVTPDGTVYGNYDIEAKSADSIITITQGTNVISLKKARGQ